MCFEAELKKLIVWERTGAASSSGVAAPITDGCSVGISTGADESRRGDECIIAPESVDFV